MESPNGVSLEWFVQSSALTYILENVEGENGKEVAEVLAEEGETTSEEIANELGMKLGPVRSVLESLYEARATDFRRSRDDETGWISFYWWLNPSGALNYLARKKRSLLQKIKEKLQYERRTVFFACKNRCTKVEFDRAVELEFRCPECGGEMHRADNDGFVCSLEEKSEKLEGNFENRVREREGKAGGGI
ncbi:hypothetical protein AKJ40_00725 [candidate division MSBL1 archaeon SCGC-AAA259M10]|uniref:Transcription factor E n=1 Tax=candidate division MSBL1 archaeon SCGC-AAA259M10 TaxID=1698270 RepID=A0A133V2S7_9EURY|nr:hypothetical protein AKJ40_00725 [candidate division MSBL1 archaeon SCGC-AAA259M10]